MSCIFWRGKGYDENDVYYDCSFNLCQPVHKGGEGYLFAGNCSNSHNNESIPVLLKTLTGNHIFVGAWQEAAATAWMAKKSELRTIHSGANFLIMSYLQGFQKMSLAYRSVSNSTQHRVAFVQEFLRQCLQQLQWLHRAHLHKDIHRGNIMVKGSVETGDWLFQIIDMSDSRPISQWRRSVQESFMSYKRHLPKHPLTACLRTPIMHQAREYCNSHEHLRVCPQLMDTSMVAVLALDMLNDGTRMHLSLPTSLISKTFSRCFKRFNAFYKLFDKRKLGYLWRLPIYWLKF